jgi:hypothetical protein
MPGCACGAADGSTALRCAPCRPQPTGSITSSPPHKSSRSPRARPRASILRDVLRDMRSKNARPRVSSLVSPASSQLFRTRRVSGIAATASLCSQPSGKPAACHLPSSVSSSSLAAPPVLLVKDSLAHARAHTRCVELEGGGALDGGARAWLDSRTFLPGPGRLPAAAICRGTAATSRERAARRRSPPQSVATGQLRVAFFLCLVHPTGSARRGTLRRATAHATTRSAFKLGHGANTSFQAGRPRAAPLVVATLLLLLVSETARLSLRVLGSGPSCSKWQLKPSDFSALGCSLH